MIFMATKEVFFNIWCKKCEHFGKKEDEEPCDDCLNFGFNEDSHQPLYWKDKDE